MADNQSDSDTVGGKFPSELGGEGEAKGAPVKVDGVVGQAMNRFGSFSTNRMLMDYRNYGGGVQSIFFGGETPIMTSTVSGTTSVVSGSLNTSAVNATITPEGLHSPVGNVFASGPSTTTTVSAYFSAYNLPSTVMGRGVRRYTKNAGGTSVTGYTGSFPVSLTREVTTGQSFSFFIDNASPRVFPRAYWYDGTSVTTHFFEPYVKASNVGIGFQLGSALRTVSWSFVSARVTNAAGVINAYGRDPIVTTT